MATPFYQDDLITLYNADATQHPELWAHADVLVTDPPYGSQALKGQTSQGYGRRQKYDTGDHNGAMIESDGDSTTRDTIIDIWKQHSPEEGMKPVLMFGSPRLPDPPLPIVDRLVWDKKRPGMNGGPWRYRHESIYVTEGFERASNADTSILTAFPDQSLHIHQKPIPLMESLIATIPKGLTIADPFAGSGSTLVAAAHLGYTCIGVEVSEAYCQTVPSRLEQTTLAF